MGIIPTVLQIRSHSMRYRPVVWSVAAVWLSLAGCAPAERPLTIAQETAADPIAARVGEFSLPLDEVAGFARGAVELRELAGVARPAGDSEAGSVELATELLALAAAGRSSPPEPAELEELTRRLLARVLLDRWVGAEHRLPITDEEVSRAHLQEVERYWATGESELYRPTLIQASAIIIGSFPDGDAHQEDGLPPVCDRASIERLAESVRRAAGDRVADTDAWMSLARRFSAGNPTLRLQPQIQVSLDPERARVAPVLYRAIVALDGNGSISPVVWTESAAWIIRRGVTSQGKGERPEEIRPELERIVLRARDQARVGALLAELKNRYPAKLVPGAIPGGESPGGAAQ